MKIQFGRFVTVRILHIDFLLYLLRRTFWRNAVVFEKDVCASSIIQIKHNESEGETVQKFYRASNEFREIQKIFKMEEFGICSHVWII